LDGTFSTENFGQCVSISNDGMRAVVTSTAAGSYRGHAKVYEWNGTDWEQLGSTLTGEQSLDEFGGAVDFNADGSIVAIGAPGNNVGNNESGSVKVYQFDGNDWVQLGSEIDGQLNEHSGLEVALNDEGTRVFVGAPHNEEFGFHSGVIRTYEFDGNDWVQFGSTLYGQQAYDELGFEFDISNDGLSMVATRKHSSGPNPDEYEVNIYTYDGNDWIVTGTLYGINEYHSAFGFAVAMSGDGMRIAASAPYDNLNNSVWDAGRVRVFRLNNGNWVPIAQSIIGVEDERLGTTLELNDDGTRLIIGSRYHLSQSGEIKVYDHETVWILKQPTLIGEAINDFSGHSMDLSRNGNHIIIGAPGNDDGGADSGHARVYNIETFLGIEDETLNGFRVYPNPTTENLTIESNATPIQLIALTNVSGQTVLRYEGQETMVTLDVSQFPAGLYLVSIQTEDQVVVKKILFK